MQTVFILTLALHVVAGVFWAGSTFALARLAGAHAEQFFAPQMGAATVVVVTGVVLWHFLHSAAFGTPEHVLALGALTALLAAGVQGALIGAARRGLADPGREASSRIRMALGQRLAAGLLLITVVCMAVARVV
jgi:hypothetical protein